LPDTVGLVKKAAVEAVEAGKPVNVLFGTVISASPLKIQVDQKSIYSGTMLILSRNVTDYDVEMTVDHLTEERSGGSGDSSFSAHDHEYKGRKVFRVHKALGVGERVVLVRIQGGKRFLVWDRVIG